MNTKEILTEAHFVKMSIKRDLENLRRKRTHAPCEQWDEMDEDIKQKEDHVSWLINLTEKEIIENDLDIDCLNEWD